MYEDAVMSSQYRTMVSALRVVIPTRLTIARSMLCINVYKGNKQAKSSFLSQVCNAEALNDLVRPEPLLSPASLL